MAGDWVKMRHDLYDDPGVVRVAKMSRLERDTVVGKCHRLWSWADRHTVDGRACDVGGIEFVDDLVGVPGFAEALISVGWLVVDGDCIEIPNFDRHNGETAKKRALANRRKAMSRSQRDKSVTEVSRSQRDKNGTREEKRREEKELPPSEVAPTETPERRSRSKPTDTIGWTPSAGWEGITDADRAAWRSAYPACDVPRELAAMAEWLKANPEKSHKRRWRAFVTRWLSRSQDRGGGMPSSRAASTTGTMPLDERIERDRRRAWWRADAGANMTDAQYQAWRDSRIDGKASGVAQAARSVAEAATEPF